MGQVARPDLRPSPIEDALLRTADIVQRTADRERAIDQQESLGNAATQMAIFGTQFLIDMEDRLMSQQDAFRDIERGFEEILLEIDDEETRRLVSIGLQSDIAKLKAQAIVGLHDLGEARSLASLENQLDQFGIHVTADSYEGFVKQGEILIRSNKELTNEQADARLQKLRTDLAFDAAAEGAASDPLGMIRDLMEGRFARGLSPFQQRSLLLQFKDDAAVQARSEILMDLDSFERIAEQASMLPGAARDRVIMNMRTILAQRIAIMQSPEGKFLFQKEARRNLATEINAAAGILFRTLADIELAKGFHSNDPDKVIQSRGADHPASVSAQRRYERQVVFPTLSAPPVGPPEVKQFIIQNNVRRGKMITPDMLAVWNGMLVNEAEPQDQLSGYLAIADIFEFNFQAMKLATVPTTKAARTALLQQDNDIGLAARNTRGAFAEGIVEYSHNVRKLWQSGRLSAEQTLLQARAITPALATPEQKERLLGFTDASNDAFGEARPIDATLAWMNDEFRRPRNVLPLSEFVFGAEDPTFMPGAAPAMHALIRANYAVGMTIQVAREQAKLQWAEKWKPSVYGDSEVWTNIHPEDDPLLAIAHINGSLEEAWNKQLFEQGLDSIRQDGIVLGGAKIPDPNSTTGEFAYQIFEDMGGGMFVPAEVKGTVVPALFRVGTEILAQTEAHQAELRKFDEARKRSDAALLRLIELNENPRQFFGPPEEKHRPAPVFLLDDDPDFEGIPDEFLKRWEELNKGVDLRELLKEQNHEAEHEIQRLLEEEKEQQGAASSS